MGIPRSLGQTGLRGQAAAVWSALRYGFKNDKWGYYYYGSFKLASSRVAPISQLGEGEVDDDDSHTAAAARTACRAPCEPL